MKSQLEDPGPSGLVSEHQATNGRTKRTKASMLFMPFVISMIAIPVTVQAGFFNFVTELFKTSPAAVVLSLKEENSQNIQLLEAARNVDPTPSRGGGDITIVANSALLAETGPAGTLADIEQSFGSDQISVYVVREGDSLSQIAEMFNVSVNTIIWSNDIKRGSLITPGQTLAILPITGVRHTVKSGDTVSSIVKKYKGDLEEVLQYNDLVEGQKLTVGEVVVVPDGEIEAPKYTSSSRVVRGSNAPSYAGYYMRPVAGVRSQGLHGYNAVDIAAAAGAPVVASASGNVIISRNYGWNGGYGKYVVIKHNNGTQTLYAHNSSNIVSQGQYVVQGQVIGYVGSTGKSTGPHVHFEVRGAKNPF